MKAVSLRTYPLLTSRLQNVGNLLRRELLVLPLVLAVALIAVPHAPTMLALKLTLWISFGLCALSLDFIWGRGGIFSFGQTAIFGLGAYAYAIIALNFYDTSQETISALIGAGLMGAVASAALGYFLFFSRLNDVYLSIVTLAVTLVIYTVLSSTAGPEYHIGEALLGGFNGIPGVPGITFPKWTGIFDQFGGDPLHRAEGRGKRSTWP
jgi:branched-chain amino acid transport system permease protein